MSVFNPSRRGLSTLLPADRTPDPQNRRLRHVGSITFIDTDIEPASAERARKPESIAAVAADPADNEKEKRFDDLLANARSLKDKLLTRIERSPLEMKKMQSKEVELRKEEFNAQLQRMRYLEEQVRYFNDKYNKKEDILK